MWVPLPMKFMTITFGTNATNTKAKIEHEAQDQTLSVILFYRPSLLRFIPNTLTF